MGKEKYVFNKQTLQYEKEERTLKQRLPAIFGFLALSLVSAFILYTAAYTIIPTPKEMAMERELNRMEYQFNSLNIEFDDVTRKLEDLHSKDIEVHRMIFGMDPMDSDIWEGGMGGRLDKEYFAAVTNSEEHLTDTQKKVDKLKYKLELQRKSLDTIYTLAMQREEKLASIPSIKPVQEDKLKRQMRHMSGYGIRIHPVHKVKKFHKGIDFTAPTGTAIQATGNGMVKRVQKRRIGYGNNVIIDHGFGYTTLYAHMDEIHVKKGDKVTKGQKIGTIGNTGTSTAPHLHYEVRINDKPVNPIDYCMDGLSPEEYKELVQRAAAENQSFD